MSRRNKTETDVYYRGYVWNKQKADDNIINRDGITFEEAVTVWDNDFYVEFDDPDHSWTEHRFPVFGISELSNYLVVSFTDRESLTRIISARHMESRERRSYENEKNSAK